MYAMQDGGWWMVDGVDVHAASSEKGVGVRLHRLKISKFPGPFVCFVSADSTWARPHWQGRSCRSSPTRTANCGDQIEFKLGKVQWWIPPTNITITSTIT